MYNYRHDQQDRGYPGARSYAPPALVRRGRLDGCLDGSIAIARRLVGSLTDFSGEPPSRRAAHISLKTHCEALPERFAKPATVHNVQCRGGVTEAGYKLSHYDRGARIATLIASNSGRPGGACRGVSGELDQRRVHPNHTTQEEDVVSNWVTTTASSWPECVSEFARISHSFGLCDPSGTSTETVQAVDYTRPSRAVGARIYADAWYVDGVRLSNKRDACGAMYFDTTETYATTLVFCSGPNASRPSAGTAASSSMLRTFSEAASRDRDFFELGAAWAVYTALHASAACGCDSVLIPFVSGGLYAGPWRSSPDLLHRFRTNLERMLADGRMPDGTRVQPLGRCFRHVLLVTLPQPTTRDERDEQRVAAVRPVRPSCAMDRRGAHQSRTR